MNVSRDLSQERDAKQAELSLGAAEGPGMPVNDKALNHSGERPYTRLDLWLHRVTVLLFVFVCAVVGVLLMILPWRPEWTDNRLLLSSPGLRAFITHGFVRGLCTGLGLLDTWIGFSEAIHYKERKVAQVG